ncbi:hypothetical protein HaLaN_19698, partial [Haematococcus lacustris]
LFDATIAACSLINLTTRSCALSVISTAGKWLWSTNYRSHFPRFAKVTSKLAYSHQKLSRSCIKRERWLESYGCGWMVVYGYVMNGQRGDISYSGLMKMFG